MQKFTKHIGLVVPLFRANIDTDQIIPKQYLKSIKRTGFDVGLFSDWRYLDGTTPNPEFALNQPRFKGASVLIAGKNFGCGSSREHAPWALAEFGFRTIIAPSYADIFYNNAFKVGLLPIILEESKIAELVKRCEENEGYTMVIDLEKGEMRDEFGLNEKIEVDEFRRYCLLNGLDDIGLSLQNDENIAVYEQKLPSWKTFSA